MAAAAAPHERSLRAPNHGERSFLVCLVGGEGARVGMLMALLVCACLGSDDARRVPLPYPYEATPQRKEQITRGVSRIRESMPAAEVTSILGEPDEVLDLFDKSDVKRANATRTGCTWWYLIQRRTDQGSAEARDEKLVRISFDLGHKVTRVDAWGLGTP